MTPKELRELTQLLADKSRLDWLEKTRRNCLAVYQPYKWIIANMGNPNTGSGDTLRTAIDAAIQNENEQRPSTSTKKVK